MADLLKLHVIGTHGSEGPETVHGAASSPYVGNVGRESFPRFTLVLPRTESMRSSAVSMAGAEHLGLGSIAAYLRLQGFPVTQLNYQLSTFFNAWDGLEDPRDSYSAEAIAAEILESEPDVVGFCVTSMTLLESIRICELIREARPACVIGLGGPHAILCAKELMAEFPVLDFIGMNDGERAMSLIADALVRGVFPCAIPEAVTRAPDNRDKAVWDKYRSLPKGVEDLPVPARDDLMWMLLRAPISESRITTSRGCNYDCTFCIDAMRYDRMWYARTAEQTVVEMEMLHRRLGIDHFWMSDDNYITGAPSSRKRARDIGDGLRERGLDVTFRVRFRSDTFVKDPNLLSDLADSGLVAAFVGLEAGSEEQLDRFKKRTTVEQHKVCVAQMRELGIALQCGFIMFEPYASFDDLLASAEFLHSIGEMYLESNFTHSLDVFPGTEIASDMERDGLLFEGFNATSPYDAYRFADADLGALAKRIETSHSADTITRDKWLYRYRTNLLPRAYRRLRGHKELPRWKAREDEIISGLNDANMAFFTGAIEEARRGHGGSAYEHMAERAFTAQRLGADAFKALYAEIEGELRYVTKGRPGGRSSRRDPGAWPARVKELLPEIMSALSEHGPFQTEEMHGGNLNHLVRLTGPSRSFVLRVRRDTAPADVVDYLSDLYDNAGLTARGGSFRLRTVAEEVTAITEARLAGVRTPEVLLSGPDWLVRGFVEGLPLAEALKSGETNPSTVLRLLWQLQDAHRHGVILGDRWGYNEVLDPAGHLHLIDFDIQWLGQADTDLRSFEMAVALFGAILFAEDMRDDLLESLREYGVPLLFEWGYDLESIAEVLDGYRQFYSSPGKRATALSLDSAAYARADPGIASMVELLRSPVPLTTAVGCVR